MGLPEPTPEQRAGWQARLALSYAARDGRTVVAAREHYGPLRVQRSFHPESPAQGGTCHSYILHPPGGVVGGDRLEIDVTLAEDSAALLTTPAANKFYRSGGRLADVQQHFRVADGAQLEWLPQETIVFDAASAHLRTRVDLTGTAAFIGWEILCLGRPASAAPFDAGSLRQQFEIHRDGQPLWLERARYSGGSESMQARWGLAGRTVSATLVATLNDRPVKDLIDTLHAMVGLRDGELFSATLLDQVLVCRYLGNAALRARDVFTQAWTQVRPALLDKPACVPRIWAT